MKKLLAILLSAFLVSANAQTKLPIQLINPVGSTSGQVITSTGNATAPAWTTAPGTGTVTSVSVTTANGFAGTVATPTTTPAITISTGVTGLLSGNGTAVSAAATTGAGNVVLQTAPTLINPALGTPTALVGTNITGTAAGLTAGTVTTNANLTGPITSSGNATAIASQTGGGSTFVMSSSPTITTANLVGTTSGGNAAAGSVGEYITATGSGISLTSTVTSNITTIPLSAGDWEVSGTVNVTFAGGGGFEVIGGTSSTPFTTSVLGTYFRNAVTTSILSVQTYAVPVSRVNIAGPATWFLVVNSTFPGTATASGVINAIRAR